MKVDMILERMFIACLVIVIVCGLTQIVWEVVVL